MQPITSQQVIDFIEQADRTFRNENPSLFVKKRASDKEIKSLKRMFKKEFTSGNRPKVEKYFIPLFEKFIELFAYLGLTNVKDGSTNLNSVGILFTRYIYNFLILDPPFLRSLSPPIIVPGNYQQRNISEVDLIFSKSIIILTMNERWFKQSGKPFDLDISLDGVALKKIFNKISKKVRKIYGTSLTQKELLKLYEIKLLDLIKKIQTKKNIFNETNEDGQMWKEYQTEFKDLVSQIKRTFLETTGIPPLTRKTKAYEEYDGSRGQIDIRRSLLTSINRGRKIPMQRYYRPEKEDDAIIYLLIDFSQSLAGAGSSRYLFLLVCLIIEIFGDIARKFKLFYIASSTIFDWTSRESRRINPNKKPYNQREFYDKDELIQFLLDHERFAKGGTEFKEIQDIVEDDDISKGGEKFVFIFTDSNYMYEQHNMKQNDYESKLMGTYEQIMYWKQDLIDRNDTKVITLIINKEYKGIYLTKESLGMTLFLWDQLIQTRGNYKELMTYYKSKDSISLEDAIVAIPPKNVINDTAMSFYLQGDPVTSRSPPKNSKTIPQPEARFIEAYWWKTFQYNNFNNFFFTTHKKLTKVAEYLRFLEQLRELRML